MSKNSEKQINKIIKFQRNYRFIKNELNTLSKQISFYKDYLISMSENLVNLHKLKIYEGVENGYSAIYNELLIIKDKLYQYPDNIKMDFLKTMDIDSISNNILEISNDIIKYSNHIAPFNLNYLLTLFCGSNWASNFDNIDLLKLNLMIRLFNPISIWDSQYHTDDIKYLPNDMCKRVQFNNDAINSLTEDNINTSSIIIGDVNAFPLFLKSLSEIMMKDKKQQKNDRTTRFNLTEVLSLFIGTSNVIFTKNNYSNSLLEDKNGFNLLIKINNRVLVVQGFAKDDMMELYKTNEWINQLNNEIKRFIAYEIINIPKPFKNNFINILNIRDLLIYTPVDISTLIRKKYNDYKIIKTRHLTQLINDFLLASKYRKLEMLILLLCGNENDCKLGYMLYDILKIKDKKDIISDIYNSLPMYFKVKLDETEIRVKDEEEKILKYNVGELSYERRINLLNVSIDIKEKAIEKLKSLKSNFQGDNKAQSWLDGFLKIPFGTYCQNKLLDYKKNIITRLIQPNKYSCDQINKYMIQTYKPEDEIVQEWNQYNIDKSKYLQQIHNTLDSAVYGHKEAKLQIERLFAQWINGETKGAVLGLCGPPGTGKTSLAKNGLSKCLIDNVNKPRPFAFLPIGGSVNGSTLVGHNYTYVGSTWGRIVDILMINQCMNPIIFIDEVDKISNTEYGKEIISILTHLTDATQNDSFEDKYFSGIPLDLSKALIVFSFNDINLLDPILRDRITVIETKPYTLQEKIHIIKEYMLPEVLKDVGFNIDEIIIDDDNIKYMIETYTNEAGVRKIKEKIVEIIRDINLKIIYDNNIKLPYTVNKEYIDDLFKNKPKVRITKIHSKPEIGLVNGLYATTTGIGGLTVIQVMKYPSEKMLELTLTGQQGEVMKESVEYALRIAYSMMTEDEKEKILEDSRNKKNFGLLVHTPEAATKKDGPSAGAAMTLAIYSVLTGKKIKNDIAMTGEIDLCKNVRAIGGVYAKLSGAKASGVKLALIPKDNMEDLIILRQDGTSPEDDNFKVQIIETFNDVLEYCLE